MKQRCRCRYLDPSPGAAACWSLAKSLRVSVPAQTSHHVSRRIANHQHSQIMGVDCVTRNIEGLNPSSWHHSCQILATSSSSFTKNVIQHKFGPGNSQLIHTHRLHLLCAGYDTILSQICRVQQYLRPSSSQRPDKEDRSRSQHHFRHNSSNLPN